jgi:hypothetical protein
VKKRAICRVNGSVSPVGDIENYCFAARTSGARPKWRCPCLKACFFLIAVETACLRTCPVQTKPRSKEWLGSPDRVCQELSICVEKTRCARCFRVWSPQTCGFVNCSRERVPACSPCPNQTSASWIMTAHEQVDVGAPHKVLGTAPKRYPPKRCSFESMYSGIFVS